MADERCTPHGLWSCTACAPAGPTLAEMVGRLRGEIEEVASAHEMALRMAGFDQKAVVLGARLRDYSRLAAALAEIDRRLSAIEEYGKERAGALDAASTVEIGPAPDEEPCPRCGVPAPRRPDGTVEHHAAPGGRMCGEADHA